MKAKKAGLEGWHGLWSGATVSRYTFANTSQSGFTPLELWEKDKDRDHPKDQKGDRK